jgi:tRNA dimethylallyltransferase
VRIAGVAELVDAYDSKSYVARREGSSPSLGTMKHKVLVIVGPTASGKSALAVELSRKFDGEVISADSRQVYRGLDIGTGKITKREMRGIAHHLLDVASPSAVFTARDFVQRASTIISKSRKLPIVVGGTGFYIDALLGRITVPDVPPDKALRTRLQKRPAAQLFVMLKKADPRRARAMSTPSERNNKVRIIRALEIATAHKKLSKGSPQKRSKDSPRYDVLWIGIKPSQGELEQRIKTRLKARIRAGMIDEAKRLRGQGLSLKRMENLGLEYRSLAHLLKHKITRKEFEEELFRDIRRYAKKQLTYWKRNRDIRWYELRQKSRIARDVAHWLRVR